MKILFLITLASFLTLNLHRIFMIFIFIEMLAGAVIVFTQQGYFSKLYIELKLEQLIKAIKIIIT